MKRSATLFTCMAAVLTFMFVGGCAAGNGARVQSELPPRENEPVQVGTEAGYSRSVLTDVIFHSLPGTDEVRLILSSIPDDITMSQPADTTLVLSLNNTIPAAGARHDYRPDGPFLVRRVSLRSAETSEHPGLDVLIEAGEMVPYRMHRAGNSVVLAFDSGAESPEMQGDRSPSAVLRGDELLRSYLEQEAARIQEEAPPEFQGERLSIILQDAHIQSVFRMISEVSGYNIVAGPDVNQKVTLHMRNVPWDQALETVLAINKLGMTRRGRVITVMPLEEMKRAEQEKLSKNIAEGRVRQLSIEAQIVEVSTSFSREIGVRWGVGYLDTWGRRDIGFMFGSSAPSDDTTPTRLPGGIGLTGSNIAVNFPSGVMATTPALGIIAGSSRFVLDAKLQALETTGDGKIISSPKVTTINNVEASISQGEEIPYITRDEAGNPQVDFKPADLKLTVTPRITADGKISMTIEAENNYADWPKVDTLNLPGPPLITSKVESNVVVNDGDTIVIGGIYKSSETTGGSGIPWLSEVPLLGWLFKDRSVRQEQRELLIFITPVILEDVRVRS